MNFIKPYEDLINSLYTKLLLDFISITGHYIWPRFQYKFSSEIGINTIWCMSCNNKTPRRNMKYWVLSHFSTVVGTESYPMFINFTNMNIFVLFQVNPYEKLWIYYSRFVKYFFLQNKRTLFRSSFFPSAIIKWKNIDQKIRN